VGRCTAGRERSFAAVAKAVPIGEQLLAADAAAQHGNATPNADAAQLASA
jgi:hypothetical protein